ncbi:MAG TPA: isochorismatase family protein [Methylomirabilota bacterium]|nr:isochorismatase family protein [Methylomirabilota bacterium]
MKALILIDLQNDLMPGGAWPVPRGDEVVAIANALMPCFKLVVATQDWHPPNHCIFVTQHPERAVGERLPHRRFLHVLQPVHCVRNTFGARLHGSLNLGRVNKIVQRGTDPEVDGASAFHDQAGEIATGLAPYLREKSVRQVYLMGLPTETTVKLTALEALGLDLRVIVIEDGCRTRHPASAEAQQVWQELKEAGVGVQRSGLILETWKNRAGAW